jgi:rRNA maturation RNase YbeY
LAKLALRAAELAGTGLDEATLSLNFVGLKEMARINSSFVGHEGPTDVICFDYRESKASPGAFEDEDDIAVELFLCPEVALREAEKRNLPYSRELTLYLVHGLLHAAGEDDLSPLPKRRMRRLERKIIADLQKAFMLSEVFSSESRKKR